MILTCVFMYILSLVGFILMMKFITNVLACQNLTFLELKYFFHCEWIFIVGLMYLWLALKFSVLYLKLGCLSLKCHYVFTCEVVCL